MSYSNTIVAKQYDPSKYQRRYGTRSEVVDGIAFETRGHLRTDDIMMSRSGKLVSKRKSVAASEAYKKWGFRKREQKKEEVVQEEKKKKRRRRKKKVE